MVGGKKEVLQLKMLFRVLFDLLSMKVFISLLIAKSIFDVGVFTVSECCPTSRILVDSL